ncbi:ATP binding protein [Salix suchowensis]|nr:ATP binding protein [Salix suchowensis]
MMKMDTDCQVLVTTVGGDQQQSLMNWLGLSLTSQKLHALIAQEGLDEVRYKLQMYRSGDFWVPTGGIKKEEMDVPPVITILLVGFSGSGKSSPNASASKYTTMYMEEHNVMRSWQGGFVCTILGFSYGKIGDALEELSIWMSDGVRHNQLCLRSGDDVLLEDDSETAGLRSSSKFVQRTVDFSMVVVDMAEGSDSKPLEAARELFHSPALRNCSKPYSLPSISSSRGCLEYERLIVCLTEHGFLAEESDPATASAVTDAVYRALLISDRRHFPQKKLQDWAAFLFSGLVCLMGVLFAFLVICSKLGRRGRLQH